MAKKYWRLLLLAGFVFFLSASVVSAQTDTLTNIVTGAEQAEQIVIKRRYNPRKALLMSAALPGLGQIYTKKYWKLPLIYGGAGIFGYLIIDNNRKYLIWRDRYVAQRTASESGLELPILNPNNNNQPYSLDLLKRAKDTFRRYRELNVILSGVLYVLTLVDANVTAHLKDFDLSEDLSMSVEPSFYQPGLSQRATGVTLTFNIK